MFIKQVSLSLFLKLVGMIVSFVAVRYQLDILDEVDYAYWVVIFNTVSWLLILDFGIGNSIRNDLVDAIARNDKAFTSLLINSVYRASFTIAAVLLFLTLLATSFLIWYFDTPNGNLVDSDYLPVLVMVTSFVIVFAFLPINQIMHAFSRSEGVVVIQTTISALSLFVMLACKDYIDLNILSLIYGLVSVITYFLVSLIFLSFITRTKVNFFDKNIKSLKVLFKKGWRYFIFQFYVLVIFTSDRFLLANFYESNSVVEYDLVMRYFNIFIVASVMLSNPVWSLVRHIRYEGRRSLKSKELTSLKYLLIIIIVLLVVLVFGYNHFLDIWLGDGSINYYLDYPTLSLYAILSLSYFVYSVSANICNALELDVVQFFSGGIAALFKIPLLFFCLYIPLGGYLSLVFITSICLLILPMVLLVRFVIKRKII